MTSEPIGSVAEEAAKLFAAMVEWTGRRPPPRDDPDRPASGDLHLHSLGDDAAASAECRFCPLCQVARHARSTNPEIRAHLASAATSLALALKSLLDSVEHPNRDPGPGLEKIDLAED